MAENCAADFGSSCFKEAVCIDVGRIYDSCSDKDCLNDLHVLFPEALQRSVVDTSVAAKVTDVGILNVEIEVESVPFNRGFYSVDMTYYFEITADVTTASDITTSVSGVASAKKKAILFGSDSNVHTFSNESAGTFAGSQSTPIARVQAVDPVFLSSQLVTSSEPTDAIKIPSYIAAHFKTASFGRCTDYTVDSAITQKDLYVSLGLFSIIQLERRVQMLVPCYDFCVPDKESTATTDSPCELFSQIKFPTDRFFPPSVICE